ncbi:hypothetical protein CE91St46_28490 [Eubacteriales bacterium]|nr:hypothetical protein CE91St46_28490 [Eubacteriales bacterium]GKH64457.1 hypothetical protein CE91St47_29260 [Eubacteriales bacterium]
MEPLEEVGKLPGRQRFFVIMHRQTDLLRRREHKFTGRIRRFPLHRDPCIRLHRRF